MLNIGFFFLCALFSMNFPMLAKAADNFLIQAPPAPATAESPLTVSNVVIDKTDKNAVLAREQAIIEAKRTALQKIAEKSMTPENFKTFKLPDDQVITTLVQDFEIRNEQVSADRYIANFTIRFNNGIYNYINLSPETAATPLSEPAKDMPVASTTLRTILVLPYFEDISGKKRLWEDPNVWRDAWRENTLVSPALTITVPLGDIGDVSAGSTEAVWAGDYSVLEKLRANYGTDDVALAVANKSGPDIRVDLYIYQNGTLAPKKTLTPYVGSGDDKTSFKEAITQVIAAIQATPAALNVSPVVLTPATTVEKTSLEAVVNFDTLAQWLEVQKRLAAISPPLTITISSLSKTTAQFTVLFNGSLDTFKIALTENGLTLNEPIVEVGEAVFGSATPTQSPLYELKLLK